MLFRSYGFYDFQDLIEPPFVTVPSTGSIGEAAVQTRPCGVVDDCLILKPRGKVPPEMMYIAAATLRREAWRFDYGRKMTPKRIADFPMRSDAALLAWIKKENDMALAIEGRALSDVESEVEAMLEDRLDAEVGLKRLAEIETSETTLVSGSVLKMRLRKMMN